MIMDEKVKILLCEDDENLGTLLCEYLIAKGYDAVLCPDGEVGYREFTKEKFDICILDVMMPKKDGFTLAQDIRQINSQVPIVFLTAKVQKEDVLEGFDKGADDYITKPFSMRELLARVKANIRRVSMAPAPAAPAEPPAKDLVRLGRVTIDREKATIFKDGRPLDLTQREYDLICFLASQPGKVFSREALMEHVWNYEGYVGDVRAVDVAVRRLREKIEDDPAAPKFIVTKRGMGYLFGG